MNDERYYCISLFSFLRFDPISVEAKVSGGIDAALSRRDEKNNERVSHYFQ